MVVDAVTVKTKKPTGFDRPIIFGQQPIGTITKKDQALKIGREEAIAAGQPVYWTGKPCKNGHIDYRQVAGGCITCIKNLRAKQNPNKMLAIDKLREERVNNVNNYYDEE
jgi:hypothetical protein